MSLKIAILEDNPDRRLAMQLRLNDRFSQYETHFFADAAPMVDWLRTHLADTVAIGIDHDLEMIQTESGELHDPGSGRLVADYLADRTPQCPVVFHSTNGPAVDAMEVILQEAGWTTYRITPYEDLSWIPEWFLLFRRAIVNSARPADVSLPSPGASPLVR